MPTLANTPAAHIEGGARRYEALKNAADTRTWLPDDELLELVKGDGTFENYERWGVLDDVMRGWEAGVAAIAEYRQKETPDPHRPGLTQNRKYRAAYRKYRASLYEQELTTDQVGWTATGFWCAWANYFPATNYTGTN